MNSKTNVARLSVISNSVLIVMKLIVGLYTGSVSIISEAIHSTMDLIASVIAFISVKISSRPADKNHPYGHGKFENISGVIESLLILAAAVLIIIESVNKILHPSRSKVDLLVIGFIVMFISAGVNFMVSRKLYKIAKQEDSIALEADALHLKTDIYTALGVGTGLLLIWITKLEFLDPIVAILVALFIFKESFELLKSAFDPLLDTKLSDNEIKVIQEVIDRYKSVYCNFHNLRTRKSGSTKCVDLHLVVPENTSVKNAHDTCDKIEADLDKLLKNTEVMIHVEACSENCQECKYLDKGNCKIK